MLESIKRLIKGVTLILIMEKEKNTIIELSFYDKQHGMDSDYPCINTDIIDDSGEEWFTKTYFSWSEFIKENIVLNHRILCSKARCRKLSHRNLILETENADLNLSNCLNGKDFARSFGVGVE